MKPTVPLREEHRRLREQLARVEAALRTPADVRTDLPGRFGALLQKFEAHAVHEAQLLASFQHVIHGLLHHRVGDHADQRVVLRDLQVLRTSAGKTPDGPAAARLKFLCWELRECLEWEEREVFPLVDRLAGECAEALVSASVVSDDH